ncbi:MAG: hypothetical protein PQJ58_03035 [Spirochaetales bacterium]|nr:hypothetical protein [Spirochaetales bacterium]
MKKMLFLLLCLTVAVVVFAREYDDMPGELSQGNAPVMTYGPPDAFSYPGVLLLNAPDELAVFFEARGIDPCYLTGDCGDLPYEVRMQMKEICSDCSSEFCCAIKTIAMEYRDTGYHLIVLKFGDAYWTVST